MEESREDSGDSTGRREKYQSELRRRRPRHDRARHILNRSEVTEEDIPIPEGRTGASEEVLPEQISFTGFGRSVQKRPDDCDEHDRIPKATRNDGRIKIGVRIRCNTRNH